MSDNKPTHEVVHPRLFMGVGGKIQHVEKGTLIYLNADQAKKLGKKIKSLAKQRVVDLKQPSNKKKQ